MDTGTMNVFHDDPFEGNYAKYETEPSYWSNDSNFMDMQLTETLDGILPIAPTDEASIIYGSTLLKEQDEGVPNKNILIYGDYAEQHFIANDNIEILTVDPEAEDFDTETEDDISDDDDDEDDDDDDLRNEAATGASVIVQKKDFDELSQCSYATFRTRTDSSSIGDYESHSSDYDDDEDDDDDDAVVETNINALVSAGKLQNELRGGILPADDFVLDAVYQTSKDLNEKARTISTNTIASDIDGLGFNIDCNNFDLADFLTKDDFVLNVTKTTEAATSKTNILTKSFVNKNVCGKNLQAPILPIESMQNTDSDSDSDVIIDVETVEIDDDVLEVNPVWNTEQKKSAETKVEEDVSYVDNVKTDPSWCPKQTKKIESAAKETKNLQNVTIATQSTATHEKSKRSICMVPNKKQCDILKRKTGTKTIAAAAKATKSVAAMKRANQALAKKQTTRIGMGLGGKNLALLKQDRVSITEPSSEENETPKKQEIAKPEVVAVVEPEVKEQPIEEAIPSTTCVKRKLNLEEYKKRRGDASATISAPPNKQAKLNASASIAPRKPTVATKQQPVAPAQKPSPNKHNEAITEIVKTLKSPSKAKPVTDPITEAKNKVLRMQQLKRAQQLKILDSTVSAKVPRVTKLPPLKEIVKGSYCMETETNGNDKTIPSKLHPDYEEIIIVSASCNTDISIPPIIGHKEANNRSSRSLLKSTALLHNISDSFQKVQEASDKPKVLTHSLIASIQNVVVQKVQNPVVSQETVPSAATTEPNAMKVEYHGEDKIIMYLHKNRERKCTASIETQTEMQPEFPLLQLLRKPIPRKSRERIRHSRNYRKTNLSRSSSAESSASCESLNAAAVRSQRSGSDCCSNASTDRVRCSDATAAGGYSSRSTRRHRSSISSSYSESEEYERSRRQRRTSYNKRRSKKHGRSNSNDSTSSESDFDRSRGRSRSPLHRRSRSRSRSSTGYSNNNRRNFADRNVSQPAVEERRIVYVGRIEQETTKEMLRRKFIRYGTIKQISIHYKETGMKYGFVTFERAQDAFTAIDSSPKDSQINVYDISFGGRRAFCRASYADLDSAGINNYQSYVYPKAAPAPKEDDSFEALLLKVKAKLNANKPAASQEDSATSLAEDNANRI